MPNDGSPWQTYDPEWPGPGQSNPPPSTTGGWMPERDEGAALGPTVPPPPPQTNPFGGGPLPAGFPQQPVEADFMWNDQMGKEQFDAQGFYAATESWYTWAADFAKYGEQGFDGTAAPQWRPGEQAMEQQGLDAAAAAAHAQATIAALGAEIEAGRLSLEQADSAFNARMDAFAEAGKQRAEMWQWTVAPGQAGQPLHSDIRGSLGMKPWISQPTEMDPFAEAQEIVGSRPEPSPVPSTDPLQELLEMTRGFTGR